MRKGAGEQDTAAATATGTGVPLLDAILADQKLLGMAVAVVVVIVSLGLFALLSRGTEDTSRATAPASDASASSRSAKSAAPAKPEAKPASSTSSSAASGGGGKKKKKKSKAARNAAGTESTTASAAVERAAPAGQPEPELKVETKPEAAPEATAGGKKKRVRKKKNKNAASAAKAPAPAPASAPAAPEAPADTSADEEFAKMMQQQFNAEVQPNADDDGWAVAGDPKKKKKKAGAAKKKQAAANGANGAAGAAPAAAPSTESSVTVTIDAKKVGIIIGPKGSTMQAIEAATNTKLDVNAPAKDDAKPTPANAKATVVITGSKAEDVKKAKSAINELCAKGYTKLTQAEGFSENYVSVHPRHLSEIVGSGGATIRAIQTTLDVKVTIPPTDWKPNAVQVGKVSNVRVGVAGSKDACIKARQVIQSIVRYHHSEVTHPGYVHQEIDVPPEFYHCVIGVRGSEIKHIRGNYQCDVYLPNEDSYSEYTLVVGRQANVDKACDYITRLMERDSEMRERKYHDEAY